MKISSRQAVALLRCTNTAAFFRMPAVQCDQFTIKTTKNITVSWAVERSRPGVKSLRAVSYTVVWWSCARRSNSVRACRQYRGLQASRPSTARRSRTDRRGAGLVAHTRQRCSDCARICSRAQSAAEIAVDQRIIDQCCVCTAWAIKTLCCLYLPAHVYWRHHSVAMLLLDLQFLLDFARSRVAFLNFISMDTLFTLTVCGCRLSTFRSGKFVLPILHRSSLTELTVWKFLTNTCCASSFFWPTNLIKQFSSHVNGIFNVYQQILHRNDVIQ